MKKFAALLLAAVVGVTFTSPVFADPDKDESGHGRRARTHGHGGDEFKEEYWDGNCKVERKMERNGSYKEERKCRGDRRYRAPRHGYDYPSDSTPGAVYVTPPAIIIQPPGVVVQ